MTPVENKEMPTTLQAWEDAKREVMRYLAMGADYFQVSVGSFSITYDNSKAKKWYE
jgi:hypothetical protein